MRVNILYSDFSYLLLNQKFVFLKPAGYLFKRKRKRKTLGRQK